MLRKILIAAGILALLVSCNDNIPVALQALYGFSSIGLIYIALEGTTFGSTVED